MVHIVLPASACTAHTLHDVAKSAWQPGHQLGTAYWQSLVGLGSSFPRPVTVPSLEMGIGAWTVRSVVIQGVANNGGWRLRGMMLPPVRLSSRPAISRLSAGAIAAAGPVLRGRPHRATAQPPA
eukprot:gene17999-biopygen12854